MTHGDPIHELHTERTGIYLFDALLTEAEAVKLADADVREAFGRDGELWLRMRMVEKLYG